MANDIIQNSMPVRELEKVSVDKPRKQAQKREKNNEYKYVEELLCDKLDTKVKIKDKKLEISFVNNADLNRILEIINIKE